MVALDVAVALLEDGRVIATDGFNFFDDTPSNYTIRLDTSFSEELEAWKDIASIAVLPRELEEGGSLVIGVKNDGTLVHTGNSFYSFSGWEDIASVYPTYNGSALVGLKFDGSLVVWNADGVPNAIFGWERIGIPEAAVAYRNGQAADPYMLEPGTAAGGENPEEPESEPQPQPEEEDEPAVETMDYGMFLGAAWIDTANVNIQSVYDRGGTILNIEAFAGNTMRFTLTSVSAGRKRIAEVRGECELEDGIGTADFEDDGWGNAGTLTFVFSEHGGITVTPVITRAGEGANWYIGASPVKLYAAGAEAGYTGPLEHEQRVIVTARGSSAEVSLEIWNGGDWEKRLTASGTVGSNGIAENISEGSMTTPQGTFDLGFAFGVDPVETNLDFKTVRPDTYWVDDPASAYYNMWQNGTAGRDWDSAEALYPQFTEGNMRHCIVIEFNGDGLSSDGVRPGCGSVIFLCGRAGSLSSTYGDVYIPEADMLTLLSYLDETKEPVIQIQ